MQQDGLRVIREFVEALAVAGSLQYSLFRGHANADWALMPSVFRGTAKGIDSRDKLHKWVRAAERFATPTPRNDVEWLVLAQHFGVATSLLDWTTSPLVALFFACDGEFDHDGCVWQVSTYAFTEWHYLESVDPFRKERSKPGLVYASAMNARSLAQDSALSLHCSSEDRIPAELLSKMFTVKAHEKAETLRALALLGYTKERLFWDMAVVVESFLADLR